MKPRGRLSRALLLVLGLAGCAAFESPVARTVDGVTTEGRFIEPEAYALYAMGAVREARGDAQGALAFYQRAHEIDSRGAEVLTRIGATACQLRQNSVADRAFEKAGRADPSYGPAWFELSRCRQLRGDLDGAFTAALEAVRLDPGRHEASLLAAEIAEARGDLNGALRLRDALSTRATDSVLVQRHLLEAARRNSDRVRAERALRALQRLAARGAAPASKHGVERALGALSAGDVEAARRESAALLAADPSNGDALVIALAAADLTQDEAAFTALLSGASEPGRPASPAVLATLATLLSRRVSARAADLLRAAP